MLDQETRAEIVEALGFEKVEGIKEQLSAGEHDDEILDELIDEKLLEAMKALNQPNPNLNN